MNKKYRISPFRKNNRYYNGPDDKPESFLFQTLPTFISSLWARKKRLPENKNEWIDIHERLASSESPAVTWIGHASFLIQIGTLNIVTDPIFGNASFFFPRVLPPSHYPSHLPSLDIVLISHNHRDHCDIASLHALQEAHPNLILLVPEGDAWLKSHGFKNVIEHTWWDTYEHRGVTFQFLPAHHWSAQGIFDRNKSLWGSWMIRSADHSVYFAGDTAFSPHFEAIAHEHPRIDIALLPIAPCDPHPWMRKTHMDAQEAVQAFIALNARHFIPMHWGTFQFGLDTFMGPLERLYTAWRAQETLLQEKILHVPKVGQRVHF